MAAAAAAPEPNLVLAGRYRLEERLGGGGMGSIWRAEHLVLRAPVAVKLLDREAVPDEGTVARFLREAQSAATLRSPHVVQIIDYGVDGPFPFIVMELLEGENLAQRIKRIKRLSPELTLRIMAHVARAVARAHEAGIVHRDLKPENVFLVHNEDDEVAKVLDFGVAKVSSTVLDKDSARTRTGSILGTPYYMSPEQAQGNKTVDKRSDLWSLGVIAFECLTGTRPFYSDGLGDLVLSICVRDIPVPSERAPVPIGFDAWFAKAVARDPDHRFQNARKMIDSLRDALGVETERTSDPDIVVSSAELARETVRSAEPTSESNDDERAPNSAIPTVVQSGAPRSDADRGSTIQVSSGRRSSESEADVNAATVVAVVPDADIPALTESQFGTSQGAEKDRRTSLGPVIAVAIGALGLGLAAGFAVLGRTQGVRRVTTAISASAATRTASQPRLKVGAARSDSVPDSTDTLLEPVSPENATTLPSSEASAATSVPGASGLAQPKPQSKPSPSASAVAPAATPDAGWVKPAWAIPDEEVPVHRGPTEAQ